MKTSIKEFIAANKTFVIVASVALVVGAKALSNYGQNQMQFGNGHNRGSQYGNQAGYTDGGYSRQNNNGGYSTGGYNTGGYNNGGQNYGGYYGGGQTYSGYQGGGYSSGNYNANSGADYTSNYYKTQAANDRASENFSDYMRDQQNYADADGNTYKLESGYNQGWVNNTTNEYTLTNSGYDPNTTSTSSYTSVTPVETPATSPE